MGVRTGDDAPLARAPAPVGSMTEEGAIRACLAGGPDAQVAFRWLYDRYARDVYRFELKLLRDADAAEDGVQETFVRLHRGLASFDATRALRPWVFTLARNVAIDLLRAARTRKVGSLEERMVESHDSKADEHAVASERREIVERALDALDPEDRSIL